MSPADEAKLAALKGLEGDLHDITIMTDIVADLLEDAFKNPESHREVTGGGPGTWFIPARQLERIQFSAFHAHEMVRAMEGRFLAILEGARESGEEVHS
ncbi:hypothetical protein [Xanthobacter aminoxidans]|uniref:Uncharacterized protein n=1 Tax=Xanthobacter aminoxidans TaxID=186280 RepID=A0ABW6ZAJ2_9HYPH